MRGDNIIFGHQNVVYHLSEKIHTSTFIIVFSEWFWAYDIQFPAMLFRSSVHQIGELSLAWMVSRSPLQDFLHPSIILKPGQMSNYPFCYIRPLFSLWSICQFLLILLSPLILEQYSVFHLGKWMWEHWLIKTNFEKSFWLHLYSFDFRKYISFYTSTVYLEKINFNYSYSSDKSEYYTNLSYTLN